MSKWTDDTLWALKCAIDDAWDVGGISQDTLRSALRHHDIEVAPAGLTQKLLKVVDLMADEDKSSQIDPLLGELTTLLRTNTGAISQ
jgi:hypothetical protein